MADGVPCSRHMSCLGGHGRVGQVIFSLRNAPLPSSPKFCHARAPRRRFDTAHTCSTISIIGLNLSDTHSLRSRYGQCGRRAWRGPGGSPRALGSRLQLAAPRGPPLLPPPTQWREAAIATLHAPSRRVPMAIGRARSAACRVRGRRSSHPALSRARRRRPRRHTSKPSTVLMWCR